MTSPGHQAPTTTIADQAGDERHPPLHELILNELPQWGIRIVAILRERGWPDDGAVFAAQYCVTSVEMARVSPPRRVRWLVWLRATRPRDGQETAHATAALDHIEQTILGGARIPDGRFADHFRHVDRTTLNLETNRLLCHACVEDGRPGGWITLDGIDPHQPLACPEGHVLRTEQESDANA